MVGVVIKCRCVIFHGYGKTGTFFHLRGHGSSNTNGSLNIPYDTVSVVLLSLLKRAWDWGWDYVIGSPMAERHRFENNHYFAILVGNEIQQIQTKTLHLHKAKLRWPKAATKSHMLVTRYRGTHYTQCTYVHNESHV